MSIDQYLGRYAEAEAHLADRLDGHYRHVVVVPATDEAPSLVDGWLPKATLYILVVNGHDDQAASVHHQNAETVAALRACFQTNPLAEGAWFGEQSDRALLLLDRSSPGRRLPRKQGVGLARKIGFDVALALYRRGRVARRFLVSTDADATLPAELLNVGVAPDVVALTHRFTHVPGGDSAVDEAHRLYEMYLRYYVAGLRWAGSPYAHFSIGSTLAVDANAYANVRGFPKRAAGEDFHLLNKARKLGPFATPDTPPIRIRARRSARVPFGTGPATAAMDRARYCLPHPELFECLREVLEGLPGWAVHLQRNPTSTPPGRPAVQEALHAMGVPEGLARAVRNAPPHQLALRVHEWFDGLKTRQLLRRLEAVYPAQPWQVSLKEAELRFPL
ncbi:MAG: hypothetical protein AAGA48_04450 [Myxococcota bacterium]